MTIKGEKEPDQVMYQGRWVHKEHFRVFVYNDSGQKLVNSYDEYAKAIESGEWSASKESEPKQSPLRGRKPRNGTNS